MQVRQADLGTVNMREEWHAEMEAWADRLLGRDLAEEAHHGALGRVDGEVALARSVGDAEQHSGKTKRAAADYRQARWLAGTAGEARWQHVAPEQGFGGIGGGNFRLVAHGMFPEG